MRKFLIVLVLLLWVLPVLAQDDEPVAYEVANQPVESCDDAAISGIKTTVDESGFVPALFDYVDLIQSSSADATVSDIIAGGMDLRKLWEDEMYDKMPDCALGLQIKLKGSKMVEDIVFSMLAAAYVDGAKEDPRAEYRQAVLERLVDVISEAREIVVSLPSDGESSD